MFKTIEMGVALYQSQQQVAEVLECLEHGQRKEMQIIFAIRKKKGKVAPTSS